MTHRTNQGYGAALRSGFREARYAQVFYTDGDGQFDLAQLQSFVAVDRDEDTVLAGYRPPPAGLAAAQPERAELDGAGERGARPRASRDVNCAFKLFPRELLAVTPLSSRGAAIDAEILAEARRRGYPIAEAPVDHRPRFHGRPSGARPRVIARALVELFRLRRRHAAL